MGHDDRAEAVKETKESKHEKNEGVEQSLAEAHSEKALGTVVAQKGSDFVNQKTNIDKVTVGDKTVDLKDGKHERERGAIKDVVKAMEKGDVAALEKAFAGLSPEQAKTVAAGLDKALKPGARVRYDADNTPPTIDIHTDPPSFSNPKTHKIMIPTDGKSPPLKGSQEMGYEDSSREAASKDLKKVMDGVHKADEERKQTAGLTLEKNSGAPAVNTMDLKFERTEAKGEKPTTFKDVPPPPDIKVYSGNDLSRAEQKQEGITCKRDKDSALIEADFDNGIKVTTIGPADSTVNRDGRKVQVHTDALVTVEAPKELQPTKEVHQKDGSTMVYDKKGHPMVEKHEDGSARVWTDKGVYNVYPDGHISKETAMKQRDGTWKIYDTKNPLSADLKKDMDR